MRLFEKREEKRRKVYHPMVDRHTDRHRQTDIEREREPQGELV